MCCILIYELLQNLAAFICVVASVKAYFIIYFIINKNMHIWYNVCSKVFMHIVMQVVS